MQFVTSRDVREGMCVAEDVCDPTGRVLIARGQRLGSHHLVRLRKFQIRSIFIDPTNGEAVVKPTKSVLREQCQTVLNDSFEQLRQEFANKKITLDARSIQMATDNLLAALMKSNKPMVTLCDVSTSSDRLLQHSVNVSVLGLALAIDMKAPRDMLHDLGVALLFHDVGMIFLPDALLYNEQPPTAEQVDAIQQHARLGFEHLVHSDAISPVANGLILRHHERLDGTGYPQNLRGDKLGLLARILAVVEVYDSLTSGRFGIPAVLPDAALSYLLSNVNTLFAPEVVVALSKRIALYPVGSAVHLNTGEYGVVAGVLPDQPNRPIVLAHFDRRGIAFKQPLIVDLTHDTGRAVQRSAPTLPQLLKMRQPDQIPAPIDPVFANLG